MKARLYIFILIPLAAAVVIISIYDREPRNVEPIRSHVESVTSREAASVEPRPVASAPAAKPATRANVDEEKGRILLMIVDEAGAPVAGAVSVTSKKGRRQILQKDGGVLAVSDSSGVMAVQRAPLAASAEENIYIIAAGFLSTAVPIKEIIDINEKRIVLGRGASLEIICKDVFGSPLKDARVRASAVALPYKFTIQEDEQFLPGTSAVTTIFGGRTDSEGRLRLSGLLPRKHEVIVQFPGFVVSRYPSGDLTPGGPPVEFTLGPIVGAAVETPADVNINYFFASTGNETDPSSGDPAVGEARASLAAKYPNCKVFAAVLKSGKSNPAIVRFQYSTPGGASGGENIELAPVSTLVPSKISLNYTKGPVAETKNIIIDIQDVNGAAISVSSVMLSSRGITPMQGSLVATAGEEITIPYGEWNLRFTDRTLGDQIEPKKLKIDANSPNRFIVKINNQMRKCKFNVTGPGDISIEKGFVTITEGERKPRSFFSGALNTNEFYLPIGRVEIKITAFGLEAVLAHFTIDGTLSDPVLELPIKLTVPK